MYCRNCGQKMADGDRFCSACGAKAADFDVLNQQTSANNSEMTGHSEGNNIGHPAPFEISTGLFETRKSEPATKHPEPPVEEFDWNIHTFPGLKVEKTEDIDFQWSSELLEADAPEPAKETAPTDTKGLLFEAFDSMSDTAVKETPTESPEAVQPAEETAEDESSLEKVLFGGLDSKTDETRKQSEQIDKFFTFNQKNEEFQRLLDQEYEKIKAGNILGEEMDEAEAASEEKFTAIQPDDPMEHFFETEGIVKGYQPKEVTTDVLERIEAADAEKAAREAQLAMMEEEKAKAAEAEALEDSREEEQEVGEISLTDVVAAMEDEESEEPEIPEVQEETFEPEPIAVQELMEEIELEEEQEETDEAEAFLEEQAVSEMEPEAEPELDQEEVIEAEESEDELQLNLDQVDLNPVEEDAEEIASADEPVLTAKEEALAGIELPEIEPIETEVPEAEEKPAEAIFAEDVLNDRSFAASSDEASAVEETLPENHEEVQDSAEEISEEAQADKIADALERITAEQADAAKDLLAELEMQEDTEEPVAGIAEDIDAMHKKAREEADAAIAAAAEKAAQARAAAEAEEAAQQARIAQEEERRAAKEAEMLKERYTSADHLSEMAKAREAFFTGEAAGKPEPFTAPPVMEMPAEQDSTAELDLMPEIEPIQPEEADEKPQHAFSSGLVEIDLSHIMETEPEEELGQTRAFDKEAILAGMAAATRIVSKDKITEEEPDIQEEPEPIAIDDIFNTLDQTPQDMEAEEASEEVSADTLIMSDEMLSEILEQTEELQNEEEDSSEEIFQDDTFEETTSLDQDAFDFSEPETAETETVAVQPETDFFTESDKVEQVVEEQLEQVGAVEDKEDVIHFTAEDLGDDYDEDKGGKGRVVLKILLVILILLLIMEIAGVVIKITAPTSDAANFIDTQLNKVIHLLTGNDIEYSVIAATEPIRTEPVADKTEMIQKEINKNSNNNIQTIKYSAELVFDAERTYEEGDLSLTQNLTDVLWYKDAENNAVYYDEAVVGGIIAFESQKMNLINNNDSSVMSLVKEGTILQEDMEKLADEQQESQTFRTLEIGEIREAGNAFYVWVSEDISGDADGTSDDTAANKVYMLQPEGKTMKVAACYNI